MPRKKRGYHRHHYSKYKQDRDAVTNGEETAIAHRVEQQEATRKRRAQCAESARLSGMTAELGEAAYRIGLACQSGTKVVADGIVSRRLVGHCQQVEPVDHNEAARQFAIAAAHGDARAQLELGRLLAEEGRGHDAAARLLADGEIPYLRGDRDGWDKWRTSAALERLRMDGDDPRSAKAAWLYALAATQGNNKAAVELAHMLLTGCDGVEQNEAEAIRLFEVAASKHDPHAQYSLGYLHQFGEHGVDQDLQKAAWFYSLAGKQQHGAAQCNLGAMYETGEGVKQDAVEAARLYTLAAANGDAMGQSNLGRLYENGTGVERNVAKAAQLYEQAAEQGNVRAQFAIGKFHYRGMYGVQKDLEKAAAWYRRASRRGHTRSRFLLGLMYYHGEGVKQDITKAARIFQSMPGHETSEEMAREDSEAAAAEAAAARTRDDNDGEAISVEEAKGSDDGLAPAAAAKAASEAAAKRRRQQRGLNPARPASLVEVRGWFEDLVSPWALGPKRRRTSAPRATGSGFHPFAPKSRRRRCTGTGPPVMGGGRRGGGRQKQELLQMRMQMQMMQQQMMQQMVQHSMRMQQRRRALKIRIKVGSDGKPKT